MLADAFHDFGDEASMVAFADAYAKFIDIMNDGTKREHLENLPAERARTDPVFVEIRQISDAFQDALTKLFFDSHEQKLRQLTRKYGLF